MDEGGGGFQMANREMRFSVVTVSYNSAPTIAKTIQSVQMQVGVQVEHVVKDGGSKDGTIEIVRAAAPEVHLVRSSDIGIYDAMNQGFHATTGDIVCFLNSDDFFAHERVLHNVGCLMEDQNCSIVYGNIKIFKSDGKILRDWTVGKLEDGRISGNQLPHPAFFVRRDALLRLGCPFDPGYRISADFKQQLLLLNQMRLSSAYLNETLVMMRHGGESTGQLRNVIWGWLECARAYREVTGKNGALFVARKIMRKFSQVRGFP
jgi:glycosyltransferase